MKKVKRKIAIFLSVVMLFSVIPGFMQEDAAAESYLQETQNIKSSASDYYTGNNLYNGSIYEVFDLHKLDWNLAKEYCEKVGGHLATITTAEENEFVYNLMLKRGYENAYFGLIKNDYGNWVWITGEKVEYLNWYKNEPNNDGGNERYGMFFQKSLYGSKWNDGDYANKTNWWETAFICEWDNLSMDITSRTDSQTEKKRVTIYQNMNESTIEKDSYVLSKNAAVKTLDKTYTTDQNGVVSISEIDTGSVVIQKEGYITRTLTAEQLAESSSIYLQKKTDKAPVISAVWVENTDVLSNAYCVNMLSAENITLKVEVDWGKLSYGNIKLVQDSKMVDFAGNSLTTVLSNYFDTSKSIYIFATDSAGRQTKKKLKIQHGSVDNAIQDLKEAEFSFGDNTSITLPDNIEPSIFAGRELGTGLSSKLPITISAEDGKIYVAIGAKLWNSKTTGSMEENYSGGSSSKIENETKSFIQDLKGALFSTDNIEENITGFVEKYNDAVKAVSGKCVVEADITALGFMEGCYDESGNIRWLDGGIVLNPSISTGYTHNFILQAGPVPIPAYYNIKLSADLKAKGNLIFNKVAKKFTPDAEISGEIALSGEVGFGVKDVVYAGGGLVGMVEPVWKIYPDKNYIKATASVSGFVTAGIACFEAKKTYGPFAEKLLLEYPSSLSQTSTTCYDEIDLYDASNYEMEDLTYLNDESISSDDYMGISDMAVSNASVECLQTNIYKNSTPEYAVMDDGSRIAVWLDSKDENINHVCLYYSYNDGKGWSEPEPVLDDGTMDYAPQIKVINNKVFVVWQNAEVAFDTTKELTASEVASDFDISAAILNENKTFDVTTFHQNNIDMMPCICGDENGNAYVAWVNNEENDWFGNNSLNSIWYASYDGSEWSEPVKKYSELNSVDRVTIDYKDGLNFAYSMDEDGDVHTIDDVKVYENGKRVSQSENAENAPVYCGHELYWHTQNNVVNKNMTVQDGNITSGSYKMIEINGMPAILYTEAEGLYSGLKMSYYNNDTNQWGEAVSITKNNRCIAGCSVDVTSGGAIEALLNCKNVIGEITDEEPYGASNLMLVTVGQYCNLTMSELNYSDAEFCVGQPMRIGFKLTNNGTQTVNSATVKIYDENKKPLSSRKINTSIVPGETKDIVEYLIPSEAVESQYIRVVVTPDKLKDVNKEDNRRIAVISYENIAITDLTYGKNEDGKTIISADVTNWGYATKSAVEVRLVKEQLNGTVVETKELDEIKPLNLQTVSFSVDAKDNEVYYAVITKGDDEFTSDNKDFIVINYNSEQKDGEKPSSSESPSVSPSEKPSQTPLASESPSVSPSEKPSQTPEASESPSASPSGKPGPEPEISESPSALPSGKPSSKPEISESPSASPSGKPSQAPEISESPSALPSERPSPEPVPSESPSLSPSTKPSQTPFESETPVPTTKPVPIPSGDETPTASVSPVPKPGSAGTGADVCGTRESMKVVNLENGQVQVTVSVDGTLDNAFDYGIVYDASKLQIASAEWDKDFRQYYAVEQGGTLSKKDEGTHLALIGQSEEGLEYHGVIAVVTFERTKTEAGELLLVENSAEYNGDFTEARTSDTTLVVKPDTLLTKDTVGNVSQKEEKKLSESVTEEDGSVSIDTIIGMIRKLKEAVERLEKMVLQVAVLAPNGNAAQVQRYESVVGQLDSNSYSRLTVYEMTLADREGNKLEPEHELELALNIPQGYDTSKLEVLYVEDASGIRTALSSVQSNAVTTYEAEISEDGKYAVIKTDRTGIYILAEKSAGVTYAKGDVDGNQTVNLSDAQLTLKAALKISPLDEAQMNAADVNSDGQVTLADAQIILKVALKIEKIEDYIKTE